MKPQLLSDPIRNPFYNRFNEPVQRRQAELQSYENSVWLKERNQAWTHMVNNSISIPNTTTTKVTESEESTKSHTSRAFAGILVVCVILLISAALLSKAL